jgi:hypothetical protein
MHCSCLHVYDLLCVDLVACRGIWAQAARPGYSGPLCCFNTDSHNTTLA